MPDSTAGEEGASIPRPASWRLRGHVTVASAEDRHYLLGPGRVVTLHRPESDDLVRGLRTVGTALPPKLARSLLDGGFITSAPSPTLSDYPPRLERQLGYLEGIHEDGSEAQDRLARAHVAVIGAGGIGAIAAVELAVAGVGRLSLYDGDRVEHHNLNRQHPYTRNDIGESKVTALRSHLALVAPEVCVDVKHGWVRRADDLTTPTSLSMVLVAADTPRDLTTTLCASPLLARARVMRAAVGFGTGYVGPLALPGEGSCMPCFESSAADGDSPNLRALARADVRPMTSSFGPSNTVVAALLAHEALVDLITDNSYLRRGRAVFDFCEPGFRLEEVSGCVCS